MPNAIKYSVSTQTLALKKGNYWIGTGDVSKGPTSTTDYWNGITPPSGGYTIYLNKASQGPSIYVAANNAGLISLTNSIAGASYTTAEECLVYFAGQTDKMVFNIDYESIVTDGLVFTTDAGFTPSYPATGSTWYDLGGNGYNGTLTNGPTFNSSDGGSIVFDGTDDYVITSNTTLDFSTNANFTYCAWIYPSFSSASPTGRAVIDFTGPAPGFLRSYLRWEGSSLGFYFDIASGGGSAWYTGPLTFSANTWHYLCFTHNSSNVGTFYFDGVAVSTVNNVANPATVTNNKITIGYGAVNSYYWAGRISNVQLYNKTLTASEILQNYNAQKGRLSLLLDLYPNAAAAYSLRLLRTAYTGSAIRVRRNDNTEQNIGFVNNVLDTASLLSFCGVGNGFITTWYDQSGNAKDATQTTAANQPQIVLNGAMITTGGKNSIKFDGTNDRLDASGVTTGNPKSIFVATKNDYLGFIERVLFDSRITNQAIFYKRGDDKIEIAFGVAAGSNYTMTTNFVLYSVMHNGATSNAFVNSSTQFYTNANWGTNAFNGLRIGGTRGNTPTLFYIGNISEFIVYASDESTNRNGIEGNINTFYSIY